jgi:hypothetical protein
MSVDDLISRLKQRVSYVSFHIFKRRLEVLHRDTGQQFQNLIARAAASPQWVFNATSPMALLCNHEASRALEQWN